MSKDSKEKVNVKCPKCGQKAIYEGKANRPQKRCPSPDCTKHYLVLSNVDNEISNVNNNVDNKNNSSVESSNSHSVNVDNVNIKVDTNNIPSELEYLLDKIHENLNKIWGLDNKKGIEKNIPKYRNLWNDWVRLKLLIESRYN